MKDDKIKCSNCGEEHNKIESNCCWIYCECREKICGRCGGTNINHDDSTNPDDENSDDGYWCCLMCDDCGLGGCTMCIEEVLDAR